MSSTWHCYSHFEIVSSCYKNTHCALCRDSRYHVSYAVTKGSRNARHNSATDKTLLIQSPDSLPFNFISEKSKREKAFHMSCAAFENMLIWTKNLENAYIRLKQTYRDHSETTQHTVSERRPNHDTFPLSRLIQKLLKTCARGLCGTTGEVETPLNR
jgi:hypothetical protein